MHNLLFSDKKMVNWCDIICLNIIPGANIFLTSQGTLKLGDFGCSVKLKNHTTMVGEINKLVGTTGRYCQSLSKLLS